MYCSQCGKQIPNNSKFCSFCGTRVDDNSTKDNYESAEKPLVDQRTLEQDIRKGTLVYLQDILSMEFSINKLQRQLKLAKEPIILHDDWFYWKCYDLDPPLLWYSEYPPDTKLYLSYSYKLNRYYYDFADKKIVDFYDYNGNKVNHLLGNPCYRRNILDQKTRDKFCTMPVFKKKLFSDPELVNGDSILWGGHPGVIYRNVEINGLAGFAQLKPIIERFEESVRQREERYQKNLPNLNKKIQDIEKELERAKKIKDDLYSLNIIPSKYRNIGCAYFIYDYFSTSSTPLNTVFLHLDLDKIQSQLDTVIRNQENSMLQQAIIISQNEELIAQNQRLFEELSDMNRSVNSGLGNINATLGTINESSIETSKWARIAAINAETCAWISFSSYIKG